MSSRGRRILLPALFDLRRRWLVVVLGCLVGAAVAAGYSFTAQKRYRATATMVVAPVPAGDPTFVGLDVLTDAGGKHSAAETAARLVAAPEIADAVRVRLGLGRSSQQLLSTLQTSVVGSSTTVSVTDTDPDARRAAQIANAFVDATIAARSAGFQSELISFVHRLQRQVAQLTPAQRSGAQGVQLQKRLADLKALVGTTDPTLRHATEAVAPASAFWPDRWLLTLYGALIGLGAGALVAGGLAFAAASRRARSGRAWRRPRWDAQTTERERQLGVREAGLAQREREVEAALAELRGAAAAAAATDASELETRAAALDRREALLEERLGEVETRSREVEELEARTEELDRRERELAALAARTQEAAAEQQARPVRPTEDELERERELEARLHEADAALRAAEERAGELDARERALAEREQRVAARADESEATASAAEARARELGRREKALAARGREHDAALAALEARAAELSERAEALEQRIEAVAARERELPKRAAELAERERAVERAAAEVHARESELVVADAAKAPAEPERMDEEPAEPELAFAVDEDGGSWNLNELERLVEAHGHEHPARLEEWSSYLFLLRDYADAHGRVPAQFDWLIEDTFRELLAARR